MAPAANPSGSFFPGRGSQIPLIVSRRVQKDASGRDVIDCDAASVVLCRNVIHDASRAVFCRDRIVI